MKSKFRLIIVSGRSGSGKSVALHALEDEGFYCIDNLPANILLELVKKYINQNSIEQIRLAIGIDARNVISDLDDFYNDFLKIGNISSNIESEIIFLDAENDCLLKRFNMTRRLHPMSQKGETSLVKAIKKESECLEKISSIADIHFDTSGLSVHELRCMIRKRIAGRVIGKINLLFKSFGYKYGVPKDADIVFDARCLPNPYWVDVLRDYTGKDKEIAEFLNSSDDVISLVDDIYNFINKWIPKFQNITRSYLTVAIGCTGGKHRSVFLCERLSKMFNIKNIAISVQHRETP